MQLNEQYYLRRACRERLAAKNSVTEQARARHAELAQEFAERAVLHKSPVAG